MSQHSDFYVEQAAKCGASAASATLANERDKYLQAQAAWQALAESSSKVRDEAAKRDAKRLEAQQDAAASEDAASEEEDELSELS